MLGRPFFKISLVLLSQYLKSFKSLSCIHIRKERVWLPNAWFILKLLLFFRFLRSLFRFCLKFFENIRFLSNKLVTECFSLNLQALLWYPGRAKVHLTSSSSAANRISTAKKPFVAAFQLFSVSELMKQIHRIYLSVTTFTACFGPWSAGPQHGFARSQFWKVEQPPTSDEVNWCLFLQPNHSVILAVNLSILCRVWNVQEPCSLSKTMKALDSSGISSEDILVLP